MSPAPSHASLDPSQHRHRLPERPQLQDGPGSRDGYDARWQHEMIPPTTPHAAIDPSQHRHRLPEHPHLEEGPGSGDGYAASRRDERIRGGRERSTRGNQEGKELQDFGAGHQGDRFSQNAEVEGDGDTHRTSVFGGKLDTRRRGKYASGGFDLTGHAKTEDTGLNGPHWDGMDRYVPGGEKLSLGNVPGGEGSGQGRPSLSHAEQSRDLPNGSVDPDTDRLSKEASDGPVDPEVPTQNEPEDIVQPSMLPAKYVPKGAPRGVLRPSLLPSPAPDVHSKDGDPSVDPYVPKKVVAGGNEDPTTPDAPKQNEDTDIVEPSSPDVPKQDEDIVEPSSPDVPKKDEDIAEPSSPDVPKKDEDIVEPGSPDVPKQDEDIVEPSSPDVPKKDEDIVEPSSPDVPKKDEDIAEPSSPDVPKQDEDIVEPSSPDVPKQDEDIVEPSSPDTPKKDEDIVEPSNPDTPKKDEDIVEPSSPDTPKKVDDNVEPSSPDVPKQEGDIIKPSRPDVPKQEGDIVEPSRPDVPKQDGDTDIVQPPVVQPPSSNPDVPGEDVDIVPSFEPSRLPSIVNPVPYPVLPPRDEPTLPPRGEPTHSDSTLRPTLSPLIVIPDINIPVTKDIDLNTFNTTCESASIGFVVCFLLYALFRSRRAQLARKIYAPRLFTAPIPPRVQPRGIWGWLMSLTSGNIERRVLDEVGLDAFMMTRILTFCANAFLCLAPFASFVLMPLYASEANGDVRGLKQYTIQSLLDGPNRESQLWIAVGMTYWNSVVVLYLLHNEYKMYIKHRHEFLRRSAPQTYAVLVERIPKQLCNRPALMHYFKKVFGNRVLSADVVDNNPMLNYAIKKREKVVSKLEREIYEYERSGKRPWRLYFPWMCGQIKQKVEPLGVNKLVDAEEEEITSELTQPLNGGADFFDDDDRSVVSIEGEGNAEQSKPMISEQDELIEEERAFLEQWQHNMERGVVHHHLSPIVPPKRKRRSHCLWILARLNFCMYIDSIKSYERELKVWNRRVKHLQLKAEKKRRKADAEGLASVVEPSRKTIQEQLRVRIRRERRNRDANRSWGNIRRRRTLSGIFSESAAAAPVTTDGKGESGKHSRRSSKERKEDTATTISSSSKSGFAVPPPRSPRSAKGATVLSMPWDDGRNALMNTLFSGESRRSIHGRSDSGSLESLDDDSTFYLEDEDFYEDLDLDDPGIFEHAGFDDILRYAVDQNDRTSAFITFSTLTATMCAAQTVVDRPLKMSITIAPDVRDVLWENLGLSLPVLACSTWLIRAILFTVIIVFGGLTASIAALTNAPSLRQHWPSSLGPFLDIKQLTPLALVVLYNLVPPILNWVLKLQRRRSLSEMQVEFFRVYYHFLVVQVFLFYTIAGSVSQNVKEFVNHPVRFLSLFGKALPANELFFLQYLVTRCALLSVELLRIPDILIAFIRGCLASSRTPRERRNPVCGLHTIDHPHSGNIERTLSTISLCFSIAMSYSVICPTMVLVAVVYFSLALVVYRNQLLYVYTHEREGAGVLFPFVFRALITGVIIFQLVMMGLFIIHTSASSVTMLIPLVFMTLTFLLFCENAYERSSRFLPLGDASELDIMNGPPRDLLKYKHPSTLAPAKLEPELMEIN
eukprot:CAMPEP_0203748988 /NCGR_PEP_ID=MMETSP0098-20131031/3707_1 /ASSEMBLY_ACC=CAM_ASM_000208 /TAXON_ID=96639 /ORGANISM=" , Strain NY0313808BC1" /LENGTH=1608 /DNA_ID=CAMNT_0050637915 /DNA_START=41 /DNA_END=4867 /DNA_ORIENTATION=-